MTRKILKRSELIADKVFELTSDLQYSCIEKSILISVIEYLLRYCEDTNWNFSDTKRILCEEIKKRSLSHLIRGKEENTILASLNHCLEKFPYYDYFILLVIVRISIFEEKLITATNKQISVLLLS